MSQFNQPLGSRPQQPNTLPHRGNLVLVLGIMGIVFNVCGVPGVLAWIFGSADLKQMKAGTMDREGEGLTKAGYICGIIGTCFAAIGLVVMILYLLMVFLVFGAMAVEMGPGVLR